jgi:ABC-type multidrug transport system fused ATPase/permease subunit
MIPDNDISENLMEDKPDESKKKPEINPMDKVGLISKVLFTWLTPLVKISLKESFEQEDHWKLYSYLEVKKKLNLFKKFREKTMSIIYVIYKMFAFKMLIFILTVVYNVLDIMDIMMIYFLTNLLTYYKEHEDLPINLTKLAIYFILFIVIEAFKSLIVGIFDHIVFNEMVISRNCLIHTILEKSMRLPLGGMSKSGKGNIINLIQVDCNTIKDNGGDITFLVYSAITGVVSFILCFYFMGISFFIFLLISVTFMSASFFIYKYQLKFQEKLLKLKDERIAILKNIFKNLKFIKFHVFENLFLKIVYDKREREIKTIRVIFILFVMVVFTNWLCPNLSFLGTITYVFTRKNFLSVATLITFFKLYEYVNMFFRMVPYFFQLYFKFKLVNIRMKTYFEIKDADLSHITNAKTSQSQFINESYFDEEEVKDRLDVPMDYAITIENGHFIYEDIGLKKIKTESEDKKEDEEKNKEKSEEKTKEENKTKFELKDINLKIGSGELTFIIGKIGSGKTSLLYSILGEILPKSDKTKITFSSNSMTYCPQKPFIQTKTVKENIAFYEPIDEDKLNKSVRMACLQDDLKLFANGLDSMLAEAGANISGGQKTRINLARCFYTEKDIYLLDDPLSSLDFNVACDIIENAIKKDLKGKTRVIVTHSIQYLLYADKIIYLDEGQIKFNGNFKSFQATDWYKELENTIEKRKEETEEEETYESHVSMGTTENNRGMRRSNSREFIDFNEKLNRSSSREKKSRHSIDDINDNLEKFNQNTFKKNRKRSSENKIESNRDLLDEDQQLESDWRKNNNEMSTSVKDIESSEDSLSEDEKMLKRNTKDKDILDQYNLVGESSPLSDIKLSESKIKSKYSNNKPKKDSNSNPSETSNLNMNENPDFKIDENQEKLIQKYFIKEDKVKGRQFLLTCKMFFKYTNGFFLFLVLLGICVVNSFADYFCLNKLYEFINKIDTYPNLWSELQYIYLYFLSPVSLVIIRTGLISYCSIQNSRNVHHKMMFSSLFGDLLGFHDRVETARLINRFSTDTDQLDNTIAYKVSTFVLFGGFLISDIIIGVITVNWWILIAYGLYFVLVFYYQNLYIRFKKDLYRLEAVTRTPIVNITNEILDGKMIIKTLKKEDSLLNELCEHIENNTKNLTTQNALTNWFSVRISLFNILIIQCMCFILIWVALKFDYISIQKTIIFLPFSLNFTWNIDFFINQFSQLETCLVSLERCLAFSNIPSEKNYKNLKELKKRSKVSTIAKKNITDFIRPFNTKDNSTLTRTTSLSTGLNEPLIISKRFNQ